MQIERKLRELFTEKKLTLALAESCTGGAMASSLTQVAGASAYFLGSFVVYSNELKQKVLRVSVETLEKKGAVSVEVVTQMLEGLFELTSADWGVAVSGIAGPSGGSAEKPVGTVFAAIGRRGKEPEILRLQLKGNRQSVIQEASLLILEALLRRVSQQFPLKEG